MPRHLFSRNRKHVGHRKAHQGAACAKKMKEKHKVRWARPWRPFDSGQLFYNELRVSDNQTGSVNPAQVRHHQSLYTTTRFMQEWVFFPLAASNAFAPATVTFLLAFTSFHAAQQLGVARVMWNARVITLVTMQAISPAPDCSVPTYTN